MLIARTQHVPTVASPFVATHQTLAELVHTPSMLSFVETTPAATPHIKPAAHTPASERNIDDTEQHLDCEEQTISSGNRNVTPAATPHIKLAHTPAILFACSERNIDDTELHHDS